jgi:formylglycine-generating enzyme required for sulfatase activity
MRCCALCVSLVAVLSACRDGSEAAPARAPADAAPRAAPPAASPSRPGPPPAPPRLRADKGDCSVAYAPRPDRDRFPMCRIPGGTFLMGYQPGEPAAKSTPGRKVRVEPFLIDQVEVTAAQFFQFLLSIGPEAFTNEELVRGWWGGKSIIQTGQQYELNPPRAMRPIMVSWEAARRYCEWAGKRLPTSVEWEFAARFDPETKRSRRFPWGDKYDAAANGCDQVTQRDELPLSHLDVGTFDGLRRADGRSPTGVHDLFGTLDEWVADSCDHRRETCHISRGRAWCSLTFSLANTVEDLDFSGVRCAANAITER